MSLEGIFPIDKWDFHSRTIQKEIGKEEWKKLMSNARKEQYAKGAIVFREGAVPKGVHYVQSGIVKKYKIDSTGREHIFYIAGKGEFFGYHAVLAGESYTDSATAIHDCVICFIPVADFLSILNSSPKLSRQLLKTLSHEFSVFTNTLSVVTLKPAKERIIISLILLREKFKPVSKPGNPIYIKVSRDDIANMSGTTRENVTRVLADLKKKNLVCTDGRSIEVKDVKALAGMVNFSE